ncbi:MAG: IPT/TIG domain-containing protein [Dehalococcoidia bacterium]|nr:IPT/TIG domain-containing protein [Dehalococcoidia bacterium]
MAIDSALGAGVRALKNVSEIPFPEFTAKLIDGVFTAIIAATIKQMEAYADLVANLAKTLDTFQTENVTDDMVTKFLIDNYPDGDGGTTVDGNYIFAAVTTPTALTEPQQYSAIYDSLHDKLGPDVWLQINLDEPAKLTAAPTDHKWFPATTVQTYRKAIARHLAGSMMDQLRAMATQGMARIVVDNVKIYSSLTFKVQTTDVESTSKAAATTQHFGAYVNGHVGFPAWGVKAGASYGSVSVRVANELTYNKVTMDATIIGGMELNGHTDYFPALPLPPTAIATTIPTLTGISPVSGTKNGNTTVTLTGTNLLGATLVKFGTVDGTSISDNTDTSLKVKTPAGAVGTVQVTVITPKGTSGAIEYKYT